MGHSTTDMGGARKGFPDTSWTLICDVRGQAASRAAASWTRLIELYWKPVYWYVRTRWHRSNEDAKDLTQEFFSTLLDQRTLDALREERPRFRAFLRSCLENFLLRKNRDGARIKRGGRAALVSIDASECRIDVPDQGLTPEQAFDQAWAQTILDDCLGELERLLRAKGKQISWKVFALTYLADEKPTYAECARELGITSGEVQSRLKQARAALADLVRERVAETVARPEDVDDEVALLMGKRLGL